MAIQKTNTSFGATLKGDSIRLFRNGLDDKCIKRALKIINNACPKKEDSVYLYYRNRYKINCLTGADDFVGIRCGVKVAKDGKVLEKNIDPNKINPKHLLYKFALTLKKLVSGEIQPDETVKLYK